jgi:ethanolamine permease
MYYNFWVSLIFYAGLAIAVGIFILMGKHKTKIMGDEMLKFAVGGGLSWQFAIFLK